MTDSKNITTDDVYFIVEGPVIGKGRPRFTNRNGYVTAYTPKKTLDYEKKVRDAYLNEYQPMRWVDKEPLELVVNAYFEIPKSASKKARTEMLLNEYPTKRPDFDNILKSVADGLNGVAYSDDCQIVSATVNKIWSESAKTEITIRRVLKGVEE